MIGPIRAFSLAIATAVLGGLLTVVPPAIAADGTSGAITEASPDMEPVPTAPASTDPALAEPVLTEPIPIESSPAETSPTESVTTEPAPASPSPRARRSTKRVKSPPDKTYFLNIVAGNPRRQITLNPPATKLVVTFESGGDALVRCGDGYKTYTCTLGKPLKIEREPDEAIKRFWAQDLSEITDVRLRIDSYSG